MPWVCRCVVNERERRLRRPTGSTASIADHRLFPLSLRYSPSFSDFVQFLLLEKGTVGRQSESRLLWDKEIESLYHVFCTIISRLSIMYQMAFRMPNVFYIDSTSQEVLFEEHRLQKQGHWRLASQPQQRRLLSKLAGRFLLQPWQHLCHSRHSAVELQ